MGIELKPKENQFKNLSYRHREKSRSWMVMNEFMARRKIINELLAKRLEKISYFSILK